MSRRNLLILLIFALGLGIGQALPDLDPGIAGSWIGPAPARAGDVAVSVGDGATFVTSDGPNAYLWERMGDRLVLLGHGSRTLEGTAEQATFVWMPGVEQRTFARP
jgi:hypothetical protein